MNKEVLKHNGVTKPLKQTLHPIFNRQGTRFYRRVTGESGLVPQPGLEPGTHGLGNRCSIRLSYWGTASNCSTGIHTDLD